MSRDRRACCIPPAGFYEEACIRIAAARHYGQPAATGRFPLNHLYRKSVEGMFGLFRRDPVAKLEAEYRRLLEQARDLQREGDIQGFAAMTSRADALAKRIEAIKGARG